MAGVDLFREPCDNQGYGVHELGRNFVELRLQSATYRFCDLECLARWYEADHARLLLKLRAERRAISEEINGARPLGR